MVTAGLLQVALPAEAAAGMKRLRLGARKAGRTLPQPFHHSSLLWRDACCAPAKSLTDERVIDETGSMGHDSCSISPMKSGSSLAGRISWYLHVSPMSGPDYVKRVQGIQPPENARFRQIHDGHATFLQPEERRFVTPEAIRATCLVGEPEEIVERLRIMERSGLMEVTVMAPADYQRKVWRDLAEFIMPRFG